MKRWYWRTIIGFVAFGLIAIVILPFLPKPPISSKIKSQLTSTLMLPNTGRYPVDRASAKYDSTLKVLSFDVSAYGKTMILSEQPTPEQFTDVPQVYQKVLDSMQDYNDFDVNVGTVHLTTPTQ